MKKFVWCALSIVFLLSAAGCRQQETPQGGEDHPLFGSAEMLTFEGLPAGEVYVTQPLCFPESPGAPAAICISKEGGAGLFSLRTGEALFPFQKDLQPVGHADRPARVYVTQDRRFVYDWIRRERVSDIRDYLDYRNRFFGTFGYDIVSDGEAGRDTISLYVPGGKPEVLRSARSDTGLGPVAQHSRSPLRRWTVSHPDGRYEFYEGSERRSTVGDDELGGASTVFKGYTHFSFLAEKELPYSAAEYTFLRNGKKYESTLYTYDLLKDKLTSRSFPFTYRGAIYTLYLSQTYYLLENAEECIDGAMVPRETLCVREDGVVMENFPKGFPIGEMRNGNIVFSSGLYSPTLRQILPAEEAVLAGEDWFSVQSGGSVSVYDQNGKLILSGLTDFYGFTGSWGFGMQGGAYVCLNRGSRAVLSVGEVEAHGTGWYVRQGTLYNFAGKSLCAVPAFSKTEEYDLGDAIVLRIDDEFLFLKA